MNVDFTNFIENFLLNVIHDCPRNLCSPPIEKLMLLETPDVEQYRLENVWVHFRIQLRWSH